MEKEEQKSNHTKTKSYSIFRPLDQTDGEKKKWPRVGVAFQNRDGSYNLILNEAVTANTKLQLRAFQSREKA